MNIVYHTMSGNSKRIAERVARASGQKAYPLASAPAGPFLLITYTFNHGEVPERVRDFLVERGHECKAVVGTGSYHWGKNFGRAADIIAASYGVPVVAKVNKSGSSDDIDLIAAWLMGQAK